MQSNTRTIFVLILFTLLKVNNIFSYQKLENGISLQPKNYSTTGVKTVVIKVHSDDVIQIIGLPTDSVLTPFSLIIDEKKQPQAAFSIKERAAELQLQTKKLRLFVNMNNGEITIKNPDDEIIFQEGARQMPPGVVLTEKVNHLQQSFQ